MWKGLGNLKSGFNDITSKTISSVAKAGSRAKELINQIDNDEFFEQEFASDSVLKNPLDNPLAKLDSSKAKKKDGAKEDNVSSKGNSLNQLPAFADDLQDISPIKLDNSLPKIYSTKNQKAQDGSSSPSAQDSTTKSQKKNNKTGVLTESNKQSNNEIKEDPWGMNDVIPANVKEEIENTKTSKDTMKAKTAKKEEKVPASSNKELEELRSELNEKDEALERFALDNDNLMKERNEVKALADSFQEKVSSLDKNLTEVLGKNTKLEELINKLNKDLDEARKRTTVADIHPEGVSQERKVAIDQYIHECIQQYKSDLSVKLVEELNNNILQQLGLEEEGVSEETRELMNLWVVKPDMVQTLASDIIQEEKIFKPYYDENLLKDEIECQKQENHQLRTKAQEYEDHIRQLESQLKEKDIASDNYKQETEQAMKKYTEEFVKFEQDIENMKGEMEEYKTVLNTRTEELQRAERANEEKENRLKEQEVASDNYKQETEQAMKKYTEEFIKFEQEIESMKEQMEEYKAMLNTRTEDLQRAEKINEEKDVQIKTLEDRVRSETAAKEDLAQQYEGIVQGMKDFEMTMSDLNTENERLSSEYHTMKGQLDAEIKKSRENEHTLSIKVKNNLLERLSKLNCFYNDYEINTVIDAKLQFKDGRTSSEELLSLLDAELAVVIEKIYNKFQTELDQERGKEKEKYNALAKTLEQVQQELKESEKREKKIQEAKEKLQKKNDELNVTIQDLNSGATEKKNKIKELQKTINELQETKRKYLDDVGAKNEEFEQLKIKYNALEEEASEAKTYLASIENEVAAIPELSARLEKQTNEINELSDIVRSKIEENEHLNMTINNLQSVIDENQQIQENLSNQSYNEIKRLRNDYEQASRKSQILQEYKDKFEVIEKESAEKEAKIKELNMKLKESEQERNAIRAEAAALINKAKNEAMYKDNLVDKRVLTSFLVKYFDVNATFAVRLGILETMSSMLGFNDDDRSKVGLPRLVPLPEPKEEEEEEKPSEPEQAEDDEQPKEEQGQPQKSLKQLFMSFLQDNQ